MDVNVLYISYDGMTDPLGQSQVIPYLSGLADNGYCFHLISCEKTINYKKQKNYIRELLKKYNITWHPIPYTKHPPVISTLFDIYKIRRKAISLHKKHHFNIVHCRSYIASLIGLELKKKYGLKFIFDMRGFWVDERVEGGLWNVNNFLYKFTYRYYKSREIEFFSSADYTISLTDNAKKEIHTWGHIPRQPIPVEVIPCCTDLSHFNYNNIDKNKQSFYAKELGILSGDFIISYLGSVGTWYLLDEMLDFFNILLASNPKAKFLFITKEEIIIIIQKAKAKNIPLNNIIIIPAERKNIPVLLSLSHISISFIKPVFSKKASSPTKMGEVMSMGIPIICNAEIGDVENVLSNTKADVVINKFTVNEYQKAVNKIPEMLSVNKSDIINV